MDRRTYLARLAAVGGLAGCSGLQPSTPTGTDGDTPSRERRESGGIPTPPPDVPRLSDVDLPVPRSDLVRAAPRDAIPAITDPVFGEDWRGVSIPGQSGEAGSPRLAAEDRVVGVERDGEARAYPLRVLRVHEIVNDAFAGPLLVTYCPLCGSAVTAVRRVDDTTTLFGVSGFLWRSDLVMYDRATESLWSQLLATAIRGEVTGQRLSLVPATLTSWGAWQSAHPDTVVLRPPPESDTITDAPPGFYAPGVYASYRQSDRVGIGANRFTDDRLHPKTVVIGVAHDGTARAYPLPTVREAGVINDRVGGRPVVVAAGSDDTLVAYDRRVDGRTLSFEGSGEMRLRAGGSEWDLLTGRATTGPYAGQRLRRASDRSQLFWFAWAEFHPETGIYGHPDGQPEVGTDTQSLPSLHVGDTRR